MASVNSPIRTLVKPIFYKLLGRKGYRYVQMRAKIKDIKERLVEEKEMALLPSFINSGDTVIDLGANYAYYVERMSKLVGNNGKVIAFEPIPFTYEVCKMICKKLNLKNVDLHPFAAHENNEELEFRVPKLDFGGISAGQSHLASRNNDLAGKENYYAFNEAEIVHCEGKKLDTFLPSDLQKLSFVKIDIEGGEYFALKGMKETLLKHNPTILIEIQPFFLKGLNISELDLLDLIKSMNYDVYYYEIDVKKLKLVTENLWDDNYIFIHNSKIENYRSLIYDGEQ